MVSPFFVFACGNGEDSSAGTQPSRGSSIYAIRTVCSEAQCAFAHLEVLLLLFLCGAGGLGRLQTAVQVLFSNLALPMRALYLVHHFIFSPEVLVLFLMIRRHYFSSG